MTNASDIHRIQGATLYDSTGSKVGRIGQVFVDDQSNELSWVTVSTGLFGTSETFVPTDGARLESDGLHVVHDKETIKGAPRIDADQHLAEAEEAELYRYYGLTWTGRGAETGAPTEAREHAPTGPVAGTDVAMTVSEERLTVGTETREAGRARLRKYTTTETETVSVPVTKEQLVVERNPVVAGTPAAPIVDIDEVEEITLREERAVVDKQTVPVEEVRIGKEQFVEEEQVSAEVRSEHVEVEGAVDPGSARGL